jgi:hypothetical protein
MHNNYIHHVNILFVYACFRMAKSNHGSCESHSSAKFCSIACIVMRSRVRGYERSALKFNAVELIRNSPRMERFAGFGTRILFKFNLL